MRLFKLLFFSLCLSAISMTGMASPAGSGAKWISVAGFEHSPNQWYSLRKTVTLDRKPKKAPFKISADSKYWLWINGTLAVREGMVKRGPNPRDTYYDELDLAPYLKKGENTISALVWYFGKEGFSHKDSKRFGFYMSGQAGKIAVVSDGTWKIRRNEAYTTMKGGKAANYRLPESNVSYVATEEMSGWTGTGFDDSAWEQAEVVGPVGVAPWGRLVKRPIPQWKDFGLVKTKDWKREGNRVKLKLPYNMQFSFWVKVKAPAGKAVSVSTDTYSWLNDTPVRGQYITKEGIQSYEHLPWMSGHEIFIDLEEGVELLEAGYRETGYATEFDGDVVLNDPFMMKLKEKANSTLYVNMRDTYFDCPDRERAQWWGDLVLLMEESFYAMDNDAMNLSKKAIRELVDWQKPSGVLYSPIPAGNWDKELPQQMLAAIALGFRNYYTFTGDLETYTYVYPMVKKYLGLWNIQENGLVNFKGGGWNWSDWGGKIDAVLMEQAWMYMALDTYADIAEKAGHPADAQEARAKMARIKRYANRNLWTTEGYRSPEYKHGIDDRGNGLMVVAGIAGPDKYEKIAQILASVRNSSPYIDKYELEALYIMGKERQALKRTKQRYAKMVKSEYTTLWELFDLGNCSYNHGWSGGPMTMMYKYIAGLRPTVPGFKAFDVFPQAEGFNELECNVSTMRGEVKIDYEKSAEGVYMRLEVPKGSEARIRVPLSAGETKIKGKGRAEKTDGPKPDKYRYYKLPSGKWKISYTDTAI
ncbi:hypothetical protein FUAX_17560 [Fulvitalea axinellae]|uniref:Alpha-L-rhamnosidase n=1 Tax=Fulvitalea axinellae TaxID=1182444 RepID=A0AAU9CSA8_9BACT|nr:hypothetical protein FUAX_17560 [Fulvitalea axinellae]